MVGRSARRSPVMTGAGICKTPPLTGASSARQLHETPTTTTRTIPCRDATRPENTSPGTHEIEGSSLVIRWQVGDGRRTVPRRGIAATREQAWTDAATCAAMIAADPLDAAYCTWLSASKPPGSTPQRATNLGTRRPNGSPPSLPTRCADSSSRRRLEPHELRAGAQWWSSSPLNRPRHQPRRDTVGSRQRRWAAGEPAVGEQEEDTDDDRREALRQRGHTAAAASSPPLVDPHRGRRDPLRAAGIGALEDVGAGPPRRLGTLTAHPRRRAGVPRQRRWVELSPRRPLPPGNPPARRPGPDRSRARSRHRCADRVHVRQPLQDLHRWNRWLGRQQRRRRGGSGCGAAARCNGEPTQPVMARAFGPPPAVREGRSCASTRFAGGTTCTGGHAGLVTGCWVAKGERAGRGAHRGSRAARVAGGRLRNGGSPAECGPHANASTPRRLDERQRRQ